jgi:predicted dehydrogenase
VAKLKFGLVGGGYGAFIGQVHRIAAELDGLAELVCGAFSADPERAQKAGIELYNLPAARAYPSFNAMFAAEQLLPADERMNFVIIATPNHMHFPIAREALQSGFHVMCDKPVTFSLDEALQLQGVIQQSNLVFGLTHNYTGYAMVREARELVSSGVLGTIRRASCEYLQGWLARAESNNKQAQWRTDPARAGVAGCFGDIGSHAENLLSFVTGLEIEQLCADLSTFVDGRQLDDDGNVLLRLHGGAKGVISASQIALGKENDLRLQVYGTKASLEWQQADANSLVVRYADKPIALHRTGGVGTTAVAMNSTRIPAGHPEGYLEAFAQLYKEFCLTLLGDESAGSFPTIVDGIRGMRFIERVVASSNAGGQWLAFE